jgi:tryptophan synthase beta chain
VIIDLVVNHTGADHPWFVDAISSPTAAKRNWYVWSPTDLGWRQPWNLYTGSDTWHQNLKDGQCTRLVAVEPTATPSLTRGVYAFDYGDSAQMAPIVKMSTLGHTFMPAGIHAGGLRYHGMAPSLSALYHAGYIEAVAVLQVGTFDAAVMFTKAEGIIPAPESAHAIRVAIDEALDARAKGEQRIILFNLSGHGHFDMMAYQAYLNGELEDYEYPVEAVQAAMQHLPQVTLPEV